MQRHFPHRHQSGAGIRGGRGFIDFFALGVITLAAVMITFMLSILSFVKERSKGTLDGVMAIPVTGGEFVTDDAINFGMMALVQSSVMLVTAILLFQVQVVGNVLLVLLKLSLPVLGGRGMGFLLSSLTKSEFQGVRFMPVIILPSILLASVFWPAEAISEVIRLVSYFIHQTYAVDGCGALMIRGWGISDIWVQLLILSIFAVAVMVLSVYGLKRSR